MIAEIIKKRKICQHAFYRDSGKLKVKKIELNRNFTFGHFGPWTPQKECPFNCSR